MTNTTAWRDQAVCRDEDPELFFPIGDTGQSAVQIEAAKAVCRRCPVMEACGLWALTTGEDVGVWGGLSKLERRAVHRRRATDPGLSYEEAIDRVRNPRRMVPLAEYFSERTAVGADGHTRWLLKNTSLAVDGRNRTPRQVVFRLTYGREPLGVVRNTCGTAGCLTVGHFADETMRREAKQATSAVAV